MPEILGMSDKIVVMCEGKVTGIIDRKDATQEVIMKLRDDEIVVCSGLFSFMVLGDVMGGNKELKLRSRYGIYLKFWRRWLLR